MAPAALMALPALALVAAMALQGCGGGKKPDGGTTATTTTTMTTTVFVAPGQCTGEQLKRGCAYGFCNRTDNDCECMANFDKVSSDGLTSCKIARQPKSITFYMYRAQDNRNFTWANDDLASLSGVVWYLHNEVVIQSCPRHYDITRILRLKVTMKNTQDSFGVRKSLFGPFAIFDSQGCHDCQEEIFSKYGYVVGCQIPGAAENYTWAGYVPLWYDLPGPCPSKDGSHKTPKCEKDEPGGQCSVPNGNSTCTWNYTDAGFVNIEDVYGPDFEGMDKYCQQLGGHNIPGEYDRTKDKGKDGISFWDDKGNAGRNAWRVEQYREAFLKKYPEMPDLPDPWCDYGKPWPPQQQAEGLAEVHL